MIRPIIASLFIATSAQAGLNRMSVHPGQDPCFAVVQIQNRVGYYNEVEHLETDHGTVSIEYQTIGGHNPDDHDLIEVRALPDGVAARPMHLVLPDGETGQVCLMRYLGG